MGSMPSFLKYIFSHVSVCVCPWRPEVLGLLELELQAVCEPLMWVLGTELEFLGREICVAIHH